MLKGSDLQDGQLPPKLSTLSSVIVHAGPLAVELVVLGADELSLGLGAVRAAA